MVRVLELPAEVEPVPSERQSFKKRSGPTPKNASSFITMPLDRVCSDQIDSVMTAKSWTAFSKKADKYYRFPTADFDKYFMTPVIPDSAVDKLAADRGASSSKVPFTDKVRGKMEDVLKKLDGAARSGMRASSFLLLLSEYLRIGFEDDSLVPADMMVAALHSLDQGLRMSLEQFSKVAALSTTARKKKKKKSKKKKI